MFSQNPAHHVLVDVHAEDQPDLLSNSQTTQVGLRRFISTTASINSWAGPSDQADLRAWRQTACGTSIWSVRDGNAATSMALGQYRSAAREMGA
jgi:hypothetical protein